MKCGCFFLSLLFVLGLGSLSLAKSQSGTADKAKTTTEGRVAEEVNKIIHTYLFTRNQPSEIGFKKLHHDLDILNAPKTAVFADKETLLLCRAEINFRMNNAYQALAQFSQYKALCGKKVSVLNQLAQSRIEDIVYQFTLAHRLSEQEQITKGILSLLFQDRQGPDTLDEAGIRGFLNTLTHLEADSRLEGDKNGILFLKGECLYRLNMYKEAFVPFFQLKMRLNSKGHPLYGEVEKRLKAIHRKLKTVKKTEPRRSKWGQHILPVTLVLGILMASLLIRDYTRAKKKTYGHRILPVKRLIYFNELREQDGRCSAKTMQAYLALKDKPTNWEAFTKQEKKKFKVARLLDEGYQMIRRINRTLPLMLAWIPRVPILNRVPSYAQYTIVGFCFTLLWWAMSNLTPLCDPKSIFMLALVFAFTVACLSSAKIMAQKTINALDEIVSMLEPDRTKKNIRDIETWITELFRSPRMFYFGLVVMGIVLICLHLENRFILNSNLPNLDLLFSAALVMIACQVIWFLSGSLVLMNRLYALKDLSINPLSPSKTMGLEKIISLIGSYNILASLVSSIGCAIALYGSWEKGYSTAYGALWFFFSAPLLLFYWVYPYLKLGALVKGKKLSRMNFVKTRIAGLFNDWKTAEDTLLEIREAGPESDREATADACATQKAIEKKLTEMGTYHNIFKKIEQSPESYFDLNAVMELAKALGFPSLFALLAALLTSIMG